MNNIAIKPLNEHAFSHKKCCLHEIEAVLIIMIINCSLMSKINMQTIIADWSIPNKCINKHLNVRFDLNKWICNWEIQIIVSFRRRISNKCVGCCEWAQWKFEKKIPRKIMALETVELNWIIFSELQKKWWICWIFYEWIFPELSTLTPYMVSWLSHQIDFFLANFLRISLATITWSCHALGVFCCLALMEWKFRWEYRSLW